MSFREHLYPAKIGIALAIASIVLYFFFNIWPLAFSIGMAFTDAKEENLWVNPEVLRDIDNAMACATYLRDNIAADPQLGQRYRQFLNDTLLVLQDITSGLDSLESSIRASDPLAAIKLEVLKSKSSQLLLIGSRLEGLVKCKEYGYPTSRELIEARILEDINRLYDLITRLQLGEPPDTIIARINFTRSLAVSLMSYFEQMEDPSRYFGTVMESLAAERSKYEIKFVGLSNFEKLFTDPRYYYSLFKTFLFVLTSVPLKVGAGVLLAMFYSSPLIYGRKIQRGLLLAPWALPILLSGLTWRFLFSPYGQLGRLMGFQIFSREWDAYVVYNLFEMWLAYPFIMTVTMGALSGISKDVIEAAYVDGAGLWYRLRYVVLPLVSRPLITATILTTGASLQAFMVPLLLNGGGPTQTVSVPWIGERTGNVNEMLILFGYNRAVADKEWGYAAATYITVVLIIMLYVTIWFLVTKRTRR